MHPNYIVLLRSNEGYIWAHELFFNGTKAHRAHKKAKVQDKYGNHILYGETGDWQTFGKDLKVEIIYFGEYVRTTRDRNRNSFLNLSREEESALAERFCLTTEIIQEISNMERDIAEKIRHYGYNHRASTTAIMRKYLPQTLFNILRKL